MTIYIHKTDNNDRPTFIVYLLNDQNIYFFMLEKWSL